MKNSYKKINKILSVILIVCIFMTIFPANTFVQDTFADTLNSDFAGYNQLKNITDYYASFDRNQSISAPLEGVARYAVGYPAGEGALSENEFVLKSLESDIYNLKYYSYEEKYGENSSGFTEKEWFSSSAINVQTWLSQIILDIISIGCDPSNYGGRNYVYELTKYQSNSTKGLFSSSNRYAGSADGLAALALNAYWGDEWALTDEIEGLGKTESAQAMIENYNYSYGGRDGGHLDIGNFRKGKEWGLGTNGRQMIQEAIYYNVFWLSQGLSRFANTTTSGSAITSTAISYSNDTQGIDGNNVQEVIEDIADNMNNKNIMGQSFETIRKNQCELQAAYIISALSAGITVSDDEWEKLSEFQLDDGSYKRKLEDTISNGEATAMAAIALDYGNRVLNGESRTGCSAFNRISYKGDTSTARNDISCVLSEQRVLRDTIENETDFDTLLNTVRTACSDNSYKSEISFFSKTPQGILAYEDVIIPKDGEPDIYVNIVMTLKHGTTMEVIQSQNFVIKSDVTTFPFERNEKLLKNYYESLKDNTGLTSAVEPLATLAILGKDEINEYRSNISFYPVKSDNKYENDYSYYGVSKNINFPESMAIVDEIAFGNNPKKYLRASQGTGEIVEIDLIDELLLKQNEDGNFEKSILKEIDSILALEIFFNGDNWGNEEVESNRGRIGAIQSLLTSMTDCEDVEDGRSYGEFKTGNSGTGVLDEWVLQQSEVAMLLSRWVNDDTLVTVNNTTDSLKNFAQKELDGVIKTLNAVYEGKFTNGKCGFDRINSFSKYISALIASGNKELIDKNNVWDVLRNSRLKNGTYPIFIYDIDNPIRRDQKIYMDKNYTSYVAIAMSDYINNSAILTNLSFNKDNISDEDAVNNDLDNLQIPKVVTENLKLITKGFYGSDITWTSSNENIIDAKTGIVTRPDEGDSNCIVKLTAKISRNTYTKISEFYIVVLAKGNENQEIVNLDYESLSIPEYVTEDIDLPHEGTNGSSIVWKSSDEEIITNDGKVNLKEDETNVTLTAILTSGNYSKTKIFYITVSKIIDNSNVVEKTVNKLRKTYNINKNLTGTYWDVFAAKSVLGDDFEKYDFKVYDVKSHRKGSAWQGTDYAAIVLQILSQGDNPYNYQGVNYVGQLLKWVEKNGWGAWGNPSWTLMALDAAAADYEGYSFCPKNVLGAYLAELKNLEYGPDLAGWALIPLSSHINDDEAYRDEKIMPALKEFREVLKSSQVKTGKYKGLFNTGEVDGGVLTLSNGCVVSGFEALTAEGIPGFDITDDYWKVDGTGVLEAIYNIDIEDKEEVSVQEIIEFGDVYYGDSIWKRVGIKKSDYLNLIDIASNLVNKKSDYTIDSYDDFIQAYELAIEVKNDSEKMSHSYYGPYYFELREAIENLKHSGLVEVSVLGDVSKEFILKLTSVSKTGTVLEIIEEVAKQNRLSLTIKDNKIIEIDGLIVGENQDWYCYEKTEESIKRITEPFNTYKIDEGTQLIFKYCSNIKTLKQDATLYEHLLEDAANSLIINGNISSDNIVTGDLVLENSGAFGTTISWITDKLFIIDENGKVNRDKEEDISVNIIAKIYLNGVQTQKKFKVIVRGISSSTNPSKKYACISVVGPVGTGIVFFENKALEIESGETAFSLLEKTNLCIDVDINTQYGVYVRGIEGLSEMDEGPNSGWLYKVNGIFPGHSSAYERIYENDYIEWIYTRDLGKDVGGYVPGIEDENVSNDTQTNMSSVISVEATITNDVATLVISNNDILKAIEEAKNDNINSITVKPIINDDVNSIDVKISKEAISEIVRNKPLKLSIYTPIGEMLLLSNTLIDIEKNVFSTVTISCKKNIDNTVSVNIKIDDTILNNLDTGILLTLPCNQFSDSTTMAKVNNDGKLELIKKSIAFDKKIMGFINGSGTIKIIDNPKLFGDVNKNDWYNEAVQFVAARKLFTGTTDMLFSPSEKMTRAMFVTVLYRLENTPDAQVIDINFDDVNEESYYSNAVIWAASKQIVKGMGNSFSPDNDISREELITMLYRYAKNMGESYNIKNYDINFSDKNNISDWAYEAMSWSIENGIISGKENNILDPKGSSTRAEVAQIIVRFIKYMLNN